MPPPRTVLHIDMDAFYAAVEQRDRPELKGQPVIIGADPKGGRGRGVVATASYEARRFGVGSAMPISEAWRRCPQGVYVRPDMEKYSRVSAEVMGVLRGFTDCVEPISIDEAFLDATGSRRMLGTGEQVAHALKRALVEHTQLTASVGVATSKLVAKIASDLRKPDGLVVVTPGTEAAFLAPLPIRRLWGVGPKTEEDLARLGVRTIGDLAGLDPARLAQRLGSHGHDLLALARGEDEREVVGSSEGPKSLGQEHTYDNDTADRQRLRRTLLELCDSVARRLRQHGLRARTVTLKYRDETFRTITRARTLPEATDSGEALFETIWVLFGAAHGERRVRLLGVYASGLDAGTQLGLFAPPPSGVDRALDAVNERFGAGSVVRASLLREEGDAGTDDRRGSRRPRR
jgi:DNA polymerase IV